MALHKTPIPLLHIELGSSLFASSRSAGSRLRFQECGGMTKILGQGLDLTVSIWHCQQYTATTKSEDGVIVHAHVACANMLASYGRAFAAGHLAGARTRLALHELPQNPAKLGRLSQ